MSYEHDKNSTLTRQVATSALSGMDDLHVRFNTGGVLTENGIKLHGKTALNLSFVQTYKGSGIKTEYNVGAEWIELGTTSLDTSVLTAYEASYDFTVPAGSETISLRFTATATSPRIDNVKLTWQAE